MNLAPVLSPTMPVDVRLRPGTPADASACGTICFEAFKAIAGAHNFPPDFPSAEVARDLMSALLNNPRVRATVAEVNGRVAGSNFLWRCMPVAGIGPISVDPRHQNASLGRQLMADALAHARKAGYPSVRLVQAAWHGRSLSLYTKLGFQVREPLAMMQGSAPAVTLAGHGVRPAVDADLKACTRLCVQLHGYSREQELRNAIADGTASVVERGGRITAYATLIGFFGHAVAASDDDLKALIGAAGSIAGPGLLLPTRNTELFSWCLDQGLRVIQPMSLMSLGLYNEPKGAFLPSILF